MLHKKMINVREESDHMLYKHVITDNYVIQTRRID